MTIAGAFNDIAEAQGAETRGKTIAEAIDVLNDVLAGSDQEAADTIEGAIRLLGQHIGGSITLGNLVSGMWTIESVSVDASSNNATALEPTQVKIGNSIVADAMGSPIYYVAGGMDVIALYNSDDSLTFDQAYDVTVDFDTNKYVTVEEIDMNVTSTTIEVSGETARAFEYIVPSLAEGHYFVLHVTNGK